MINLHQKASCLGTSNILNRGLPFVRKPTSVKLKTKTTTTKKYSHFSRTNEIFLEGTRTFLVRTRMFLEQTRFFFFFLERARIFLEQTSIFLVQAITFLVYSRKNLARTRNILVCSTKVLVCSSNFLVCSRKNLVRTRNILVRTRLNILVHSIFGLTDIGHSSIWEIWLGFCEGTLFYQLYWRGQYWVFIVLIKVLQALHDTSATVLIFVVAHVLV